MSKLSSRLFVLNILLYATWYSVTFIYGLACCLSSIVFLAIKFDCNTLFSAHFYWFFPHNRKHKVPDFSLKALLAHHISCNTESLHPITIWPRMQVSVTQFLDLSYKCFHTISLKAQHAWKELLVDTKKIQIIVLSSCNGCDSYQSPENATHAQLPACNRPTVSHCLEMFSISCLLTQIMWNSPEEVAMPCIDMHDRMLVHG